MQSINLEYIELIALEGLCHRMIEAAPPKLQGIDLSLYQALQSSLAKIESALSKEKDGNE